MTTIRVTGLFDIEDDEHDPDHPTGLTNEAFDRYRAMFPPLDDLDFTVEES